VQGDVAGVGDHEGVGDQLTSAKSSAPASNAGLEKAPGAGVQEFGVVVGVRSRLMESGAGCGQTKPASIILRTTV
jgi:hypothetical protein